MEIKLSEAEYKIISGWYFCNEGEGFGKNVDDMVMLKLAKKFKDTTTVDYLKERVRGWLR